MRLHHFDTIILNQEIFVTTILTMTAKLVNLLIVSQLSLLPRLSFQLLLLLLLQFLQVLAKTGIFTFPQSLVTADIVLERNLRTKLKTRTGKMRKSINKGELEESEE